MLKEIAQVRERYSGQRVQLEQDLAEVEKNMESATEGLEELKTQQGRLVGSKTTCAEVEAFYRVAGRIIAEVPEYAQVFTEIQKVGAEVLGSMEQPPTLREGRPVGAGVWPTQE
eukprot:1717575-Amphidinium_carterae.2